MNKNTKAIGFRAYKEGLASLLTGVSGSFNSTQGMLWPYSRCELTVLWINENYTGADAGKAAELAAHFIGGHSGGSVEHYEIDVSYRLGAMEGSDADSYSAYAMQNLMQKDNSGFRAGIQGFGLDGLDSRLIMLFTNLHGNGKPAYAAISEICHFFSPERVFYASVFRDSTPEALPVRPDFIGKEIRGKAIFDGEEIMKGFKGNDGFYRLFDHKLESLNIIL